MGATSYIQFFQTGTLNSDPRNSRSTYEKFDKPRGNIYAKDKLLVNSVKSNDNFKYLRKYSDGKIYAPVTGFFSLNFPADRGVEASLDSILTSENDMLGWSRFANLLTGNNEKVPSVRLTIDPIIQETTYSYLKDLEAAAVIMDPKTGAVLAMVSTPSYDPNKLATHTAADATKYYNALSENKSNPMLNKVTSELYPPGSTFKIINSSIMLESGKYNEDTVLPSPKKYTIPNSTATLENFGYPACSRSSSISFKLALANSCNNPFAMTMVKFGARPMLDKMKDYGYGENIDLDSNISHYPFRVTASPLPDDLSLDRVSQAAIGSMDSKLTPMQDALLSMGVANTGTIMKPYIVDSVIDGSSNIVYNSTPTIFKSNVISSSTAVRLKEMLIGSVPKAIQNNTKARGKKVSGKTGTKPLETGDTLSWFTGMMPVDDPKYVIAVMTKNSSLPASQYALNILGSIDNV